MYLELWGYVLVCFAAGFAPAYLLALFKRAIQIAAE